MLSRELELAILLVEDEALIRLMVSEELSLAGFQVCEAENGPEAARLIDTPSAVFGLLITDVHIPGGLDGMHVADLMRARFPEVPIIYTTGRPDVLENFRRLGPKQTVLPKPFFPSELITLVKQVLHTS